MTGQWRGREWSGPTPGWVIVRCGKCAQRFKNDKPTVIGEALGKEIVTGLKDLPLDLLLGDFEEDWTGAPMLPERDDYAPYVSTWKSKSFGPLRQILQGGRRVDAKRYRADVAARNPWLDDEQIDALMADELGGARTTRSELTKSYCLVDVVNGKSQLWCGRCKTTHEVGRRRLDELVPPAREHSCSILVTPGRGLSIPSIA